MGKKTEHVCRPDSIHICTGLINQAPICTAIIHVMDRQIYADDGAYLYYKLTHGHVSYKCIKQDPTYIQLLIPVCQKKKESNKGAFDRKSDLSAFLGASRAAILCKVIVSESDTSE